MRSPTLTTDAEGACEAPPEIATVQARVVGEGESLSGARDHATDHVATLRESISEVAPDEVRTVDLEVQATDEMFDPSTDASFQGTARLQIRCLPDQAGVVVRDVTDAGGQIEAVQFHLHEETRRQLENEAVAAAMTRAREKAEQMAAAEGLTVEAVCQATLTGSTDGMQSIVDDALGSTASTDLHPSPIRVTEGVNVEYEVSPE